MSPAAFKVLSAAYDNYKRTGDLYFSYQAKNADDWRDSIEVVQQLASDGYIDEVSDFVFARPIVANPLSFIDFNITDRGIEYMRRKGETNQ